MLQVLLGRDDVDRHHVLRITAASLMSAGNKFGKSLYSLLFRDDDDELTTRLAIQCAVFGMEVFFPSAEDKKSKVMELVSSQHQLFLESFCCRVADDELDVDDPIGVLRMYSNCESHHIVVELQSEDLYTNEEAFGLALSQQVSDCTSMIKERFMFHMQTLCLFGWQSCFKASDKNQMLSFEEARCAETISIVSNAMIEQKSDKEWGTALIGLRMAPNSGVYRWNIKVSKCDKGHVFIGVATQEANSSSYLGGDRFGWGLIGTKVLWHNRSKMGSYRLGFRSGDVVQVTFDSKDGVLSFSTRDKDWGPAFRIDNSNMVLLPAVALYQKGDAVELVSSDSPRKRSKKKKKIIDIMNECYDKVTASTSAPYFLENWDLVTKEKHALLLPLVSLLCLWPDSAIDLDSVLDLTSKLLEMLSTLKKEDENPFDVSGEWILDTNNDNALKGITFTQSQLGVLTSPDLPKEGRVFFTDHIEFAMKDGTLFTGRIMRNVIVGVLNGTQVHLSRTLPVEIRNDSILMELLGMVCGKMASILTRGLDLNLTVENEIEEIDEIDNTNEFVNLLQGGFPQASITEFLQKQIQQHQNLFSNLHTSTTNNNYGGGEKEIELVQHLDTSMLRVAPSDFVKIGGAPMRSARHLVIAAMLVHTGVLQEARLLKDSKPSRLLISVWRAAQRIIEWAIQFKQTSGTTYVLLAEKLTQKARFLLKIQPSLSQVNLDYESELFTNVHAQDENVFSDRFADELGDVELWKKAAHQSTSRKPFKHTDILESLARFVKSDVKLQRLEQLLMDGAWKALQRCAGLNLFMMLMSDKPKEFKVGVLPWVSPALRGGTVNFQSVPETPAHKNDIPELSPFDFMELGLVTQVSAEKKTSKLKHYTTGTQGCGKTIRSQMNESFTKLYALLRADLELAIASNSGEWQLAIVNAWHLSLAQEDHEFVSNVGIFETFHRVLENARNSNQSKIIRSTLRVVRSLASQVVLSVSSSSRSLSTRTISAPALGKSVFELLFDELDAALEEQGEEEEYCFQVILLLYTVSMDSMFIKQIRIESLFTAILTGSVRIQHRTIRLLGRLLPNMAPNKEHVNQLMELVMKGYPYNNRASDVVGLIRRLMNLNDWRSVCQEEIRMFLKGPDTSMKWAAVCVLGGNMEQLRVCGKVRLSPYLLSRVDDVQFDDIRMLVRKPAILSSINATAAKVLLPDEEPATLISASMDSKMLIPVPEVESIPESMFTIPEFKELVDGLSEQENSFLRIAILKSLASTTCSVNSTYLKSLALQDTNASLQDIFLIEMWRHHLLQEKEYPDDEENPILQEMLSLGLGFPADACQLALEKCDNDLQMAVEFCLENNHVTLTKLMGMGFSQELCKQAIDQVGEQFDLALSYILANDEIQKEEDRTSSSFLMTLAGLDAVSIKDNVVSVKPKMSGFPSFGAKDLLLVSGCWYYEVILHSDNCMQIGWADASFTGDATKGDGVGDDEKSWAYDGYRQLAWHRSSKKWGQQWSSGDCVCVAVDMDKGELWFGLNGKYFHDNPMASGLRKDIDFVGGLYPAASLNRTEKMEFVFDGFKHNPPFEHYRPLNEAWGSLEANARHQDHVKGDASIIQQFVSLTSDCFEEQVLTQKSKDRYFASSWSNVIEQEEEYGDLSLVNAIRNPSRAVSKLKKASKESIQKALEQTTRVLEILYARISLFRQLDHNNIDVDLQPGELILLLKLLSYDLQTYTDIGGLLSDNSLLDRTSDSSESPLLDRLRPYLNSKDAVFRDAFITQVGLELSRASMRMFADVEWRENHRTTSSLMSRAKQYDFMNVVGESDHIAAHLPCIRFACWFTEFLHHDDKIVSAWTLTLRSPGVALKSTAARQLCNMVHQNIKIPDLPVARIQNVVQSFLTKHGVASPVHSYYSQILMELLACFYRPDRNVLIRPDDSQMQFTGTFEQYFFQQETSVVSQIEPGDLVVKSDGSPNGVGYVIDTCEDDEEEDHVSQLVVSWVKDKSETTEDPKSLVAIEMDASSIIRKPFTAPRVVKNVYRADCSTLKFGDRFRMGVIILLDMKQRLGSIEFPDIKAKVQVECFHESKSNIRLVETGLIHGSCHRGWEFRFGTPHYIPGTEYHLERYSNDSLQGTFRFNSSIVVTACIHDLQHREMANKLMIEQELRERDQVEKNKKPPLNAPPCDLLEALLRPLMNQSVVDKESNPIEKQREKVQAFMDSKVKCTLLFQDQCKKDVEFDPTLTVKQAVDAASFNDLPDHYRCFAQGVLIETDQLVGEFQEIHIECQDDDAMTIVEGDDENDPVVVTGTLNVTSAELFRFNPDTRGSSMKLSNENKTVTLNPIDSDARGAVLGDIGFASGIHYWEVQVNMDGAAQDYGSVFVGVSERPEGLYPAGTQMSFLKRWDRTPSAFGFVNFRATLESKGTQSMEHIYGEFYRSYFYLQ